MVRHDVVCIRGLVGGEATWCIKGVGVPQRGAKCVGTGRQEWEYTHHESMVEHSTQFESYEWTCFYILTKMDIHVF